MISNIIQHLLGTNNETVIGIFTTLFTTVALPLILFTLKSWHSESVKRRDRRRQLYAEALAACMEYKEFPYVIYRRNGKQPYEERTRISEALRDVQRRISHHQAWLKTESKSIAECYDDLVKTLRSVAGAEMKHRWKADPIKADSEMTVAPKFNWHDIEEKERAYIEEVRKHLAPIWQRIFIRKKVR